MSWVYSQAFPRLCAVSVQSVLAHTA